MGWLAALAVVACIGVAHAEDINGARFSVPARWTASEHNGSRVAVPSGLERGELMMGIVLGVQPITGTPAHKLDEVAATLNVDAKVVSTSEITTTQRGAAGTLYIKNYDVDSKDLGAHNRMVAILVRGSQCAVAVFLISNSATLTKYGAGLQTIVTSLEVVGPGRAPRTPAPAAPSAPSPPAAPAAPAKRSAIPTGNTPDAYPGGSGFLPSGRGVAVPAARIVDGRPEGIWWYPQVRGAKTVALRVIYLPDGTCASSPRPGAPQLFDLEGQRRLGGVGTCTVANGTLTRVIDGHTQTHRLTAGSDGEGPYMNLGAGRHRPLAPVDAAFLVGTWKGAGASYTFRADGTFTSGHVSDVAAVGNGGTWAAEGYLVFIRPTGQDGWVSTIGSTTKDFIVIDSTLYTRQR